MGTESGRAAVLLRQARTLNLQTGNLLNWGRLRKKCPATPSEEVSLKKEMVGVCVCVYVCVEGGGRQAATKGRPVMPSRRDDGRSWTLGCVE